MVAVAKTHHTFRTCALCRHTSMSRFLESKLGNYGCGLSSVETGELRWQMQNKINLIFDSEYPVNKATTQAHSNPLVQSYISTHNLARCAT